MARQPANELLLPFFVRASLANSEGIFSAVSVDAIAHAMAELEPIASELRSELEVEIYETAETFSVECNCEPYLGVPGVQRQLLRRLSDGGDIHEILDAMAPEFRIEVAGYLREPDAGWVMEPTGEPPEIVARVRLAAGKLLRDYEAPKGRPSNLALERAVRSLIDILQPLTGEFPAVMGNKNNGAAGPTPGCSASRAIEILVRGIGASRTTTAAMNMITKVRHQSEPTEDPMMALLRANPISVLDCSLLPGRHEAIEALRSELHPL
jgi:hypothetical protein